MICMQNVQRGLRCTYCPSFRSRSNSCPCETELYPNSVKYMLATGLPGCIYPPIIWISVCVLNRNAVMAYCAPKKRMLVAAISTLTLNPHQGSVDSAR
jgi:hypothetical protein